MVTLTKKINSYLIINIYIKYFIHCKLIRNGFLYGIDERFSNIVCLNRVEADNAAFMHFFLSQVKKNGWIVFITLLVINFFQYLKKTITVESITKISEKNFEIQDDSDFLNLWPVTYTSTFIEIKVCIFQFKN